MKKLFLSVLAVLAIGFTAMAFASPDGFYSVTSGEKQPLAVNGLVSPTDITIVNGTSVSLFVTIPHTSFERTVNPNENLHIKNSQEMNVHVVITHPYRGEIFNDVVCPYAVISANDLADKARSDTEYCK